AGEIDYECDPVLGTLGQVRAGSVRALAVAARKRSPMLPDVPTSHEQGLPQFDIAPFYAVFVPSGTPQPTIENLAEALNKGLGARLAQASDRADPAPERYGFRVALAQATCQNPPAFLRYAARS